MKNWVSYLIIIILVVAIIAIGFLIFNVLKPSNNDVNTNVVSTEEPKPQVDIHSEIKDNVAVVDINATIADGIEISQIELPDGTSVVASSTTYEIKQNGEYTFTVHAKNGQSTTKTITISEIEEGSSKNPYMPEGFKEVGGYPESGYVIEDDFGNQYVWVPVASGKLTRKTMLDTEYEETNSGASDLVNSVAKNYGFYIARFEASQYEIDGKTVAASMSGKTPWTNINCQDAINVSVESGEAFGYTDCKTSLISSFAWDTVLEWIDITHENYSSNTNNGNYSGTIYPTGYTEEDNINNVCDLAGNVREWTTEIYKSQNTNDKKKNKDEITSIYRVVRGGSANLNRTPAAHIGYGEDTSDAYWGFRMVLYK